MVDLADGSVCVKAEVEAEVEVEAPNEEPCREEVDRVHGAGR